MTKSDAGAIGTAAPASALAHGSVFLTVVIWGTLPPIFKDLLQHFDPFGLSALRYVAAGAIALPVCCAIYGFAWLRGVHVGRLALLGLFGMAGFSTCYTVGLNNSNTIAAIVVLSAGPAIAILFARVAYRIPLQRGAWVAFLLAGAGSWLASAFGERAQGGLLGFQGGEILLIAGNVCWTWYSQQAQRWFGDLGQLRVGALSMATGGVWSILIWVVMLWAGAAWAPDFTAPRVIPYLAWIIVASGLVSIVTWNFAVSRLGIVVPSLYLNLVPIVGAATAAVLGATPSLMQILGAALVIAGMVQLQLRRRG